MTLFRERQKRFSAVIFDLDGTLRHDTPPFTETAFAYAASLGAPDDSEKCRKAMGWVHYYWAQSPELAEDLQRFDMQLSKEFWIFYTARSLRQLGCSEAQAELLAPQVQEKMETTYTPEDIITEDGYTTLRTLKEMGLRLAVVSNRSQPFMDVLERHNIKAFFDFVLAAGEINTWKPDPNIFTYAASRLDVAPENALYVGDNYYADVLGATQAGMPAVLYDPRQVFIDVECSRIEQLADILMLVEQHPPA